jgi:hypothetical protein
LSFALCGGLLFLCVFVATAADDIASENAGIALAYNLGNFLRTLATPEPIKDWTPTDKSTISLPSWFGSRGRFGRLVILVR